MKHRLILISLGICLSACATTGSQAGRAAGDVSPDPGPAPSFQRPIDLLPEVTGTLSWKITTQSETAQAYFDQGFQLRFAYGVDAAVRSFREAHTADPECAMCYWGEAFALGSFLNGAITVEQAPHALVAIRRAAELAESNATPLERDLIEATAARYVEDYDPDMKGSLDEAFASAMRQVHEKYPDELNITAIYASALFLLEPRRGTRDMDDPGVMPPCCARRWVG